MIRTFISRFYSTCTRMPLLRSRAPFLRPLYPTHLLPSYVAPPSGLSGLTSGVLNFSSKMRKVKAKQLAKKKVKLYKMKSHSGFKKRFWVTGGLNDKKFKFKSAGARHLMRNKSWKCKMRKRRMRTLVTRGDNKRAKQMMPYYKRKKTLRWFKFYKEIVCSRDEIGFFFFERGISCWSNALFFGSSPALLCVRCPRSEEMSGISRRSSCCSDLTSLSVFGCCSCKWSLQLPSVFCFSRNHQYPPNFTLFFTVFLLS